jgi:hypothetical protein
MARISDLEVNSDKTTVQISSYKFSGLGDCHRFIHEETTHQRFDTFYNMISLLHRVGAPSVTISETLKEQDQLARAGHSSKSSAVIISSFQTKIPACLAKGGTASTSPFPAYSMWKCGDYPREMELESRFQAVCPLLS